MAFITPKSVHLQLKQVHLQEREQTRGERLCTHNTYLYKSAA